MKSDRDAEFDIKKRGMSREERREEGRKGEKGRGEKRGGDGRGEEREERERRCGGVGKSITSVVALTLVHD